VTDELSAVPTSGQVLIYREGETRLRVRVEGNTVWLTQAGIAALYQTTPQNVTMHLRDAYESGELTHAATCKDFLQVRQEGNREVERQLKHYNLDAILSVGYRVRSERGTLFRQWATAQLRELLVKGFVLDDERIKAGRTIGQDYFDELLERIRDIRSSERLFYQKITDIYATSIDYDPNAETSMTFFATVQNKLHWAIHGRTAAEIIRSRADARKPHMGLTTWKNAPAGPVRQTDVVTAKNYLNEKELSELNRVVSMYLDYAEDQAKRHKPMHMTEWVARLDAFLQFNERNILKHAGTISHELAQAHALEQFSQYDAKRLAEEAAEPSSDFDKLVEQTRRTQAKLPPPKPAPPKKRRIGFGPDDDRTGSSSDFVARDRPPTRRACKSTIGNLKSRIHAPARRHRSRKASG